MTTETTDYHNELMHSKVKGSLFGLKDELYEVVGLAPLSHVVGRLMIGLKDGDNNITAHVVTYPAAREAHKTRIPGSKKTPDVVF